MSNKKQSAVEWLFNKLIKHNPNLLGFGDYLEQAKAMDKEQKLDAIYFGQNNHSVSISTDEGKAEQYYNETYEHTTK
jgi:hypothetical protein